MLDLTGKVALITGLGQSEGEGWGIGAACAFQLAKQGAKVFGGNRSLQSAETTCRKIRAAGGTCDVVQTDVTSAASVQQLVESCMAQHGRIDILINNVGRSEPGCPATMSEAVWDAQMDINLKSVYLTCRFVLPVMEAQGSGAIVSIGSIAGLRYIGKAQIAYNTCKAALLQFSKATAVMYASKGVRLNCVVPGLMIRLTPRRWLRSTRAATMTSSKNRERVRCRWALWGVRGMLRMRQSSLLRRRHATLRDRKSWWMVASLHLLEECKLWNRMFKIESSCVTLSSQSCRSLFSN